MALGEAMVLRLDGDQPIERRGRPTARLLTLLLLALAAGLAGMLPGDGAVAGHAAAPNNEAILAAPATCPASIGLGETIQCSISAAGEVDAYAFAANAGDKVLVRMTGTTGSFWPGVGIYSGNTQLCDAHGPGTAEVASCALAGGTYTIRARDGFSGAGTGSYNLYLQRLNGPGNATPIAFGQALLGTIGASAEMDAHTFAADAGDRVLFRASVVPGSNLWSGVRVYGPDGTKLCEAHAPGTAEIATCILPTPGTHTILTYDGFAGAGTGSYNLYLQRLNGPGNATPIAFGQALLGTIGASAEMDAYTFAATAGDSVVVRMTVTAGSLWSGVRVYGPDGTKLCEAHGPGTAEIATCTLPSTGTHMILAYDGFAGTSTGSYELRVFGPSISEISPNRGGNAGFVTVQITGWGFQADAAVTLERGGETPIPGTESTRIDTTGIRTKFDLRGATTGPWDVVVRSVGRDLRVANGFTVERGGAAQVWVDIVGRDAIRANRPQTFNVLYGNRGNVDAPGVLVWIRGIPLDATVELDVDRVEIPLPIGLRQRVDEHVFFEAGGERVIALAIRDIRPGMSGVIPVTLTVPTARDFRLSVLAASP